MRISSCDSRDVANSTEVFIATIDCGDNGTTLQGSKECKEDLTAKTLTKLPAICENNNPQGERCP